MLEATLETTIYPCWLLAGAGSITPPSKRSSPLQDERLETSGLRPRSPGPHPAVAVDKIS